MTTDIDQLRKYQLLRMLHTLTPDEAQQAITDLLDEIALIRQEAENASYEASCDPCECCDGCRNH